MKKIVALILVICLCVSFGACSAGSKGVKNITLATNTCEITQDDTYQLSYSVFPEEANTDGLKWVSADEKIATVDATGKITAVSVGQTVITIDNGEDILATCSVTVREKPAYERLSEKEKAFVDCFLSKVSIFKKPESVVVEGIQFVESDSGDIEDFWIVKVSAQNSFGDTTSETYFLDKKAGFHGNGIAYLGISDSSYRVTLINKAIAEKR